MQISYIPQIQSGAIALPQARLCEAFRQGRRQDVPNFLEFQTASSSWWFQTNWKISVRLDHFAKKGWKSKIFEATT